MPPLFFSFVLNDSNKYYEVALSELIIIVLTHKETTSSLGSQLLH